MAHVNNHHGFGCSLGHVDFTIFNSMIMFLSPANITPSEWKSGRISQVHLEGKIEWCQGYSSSFGRRYLRSSGAFSLTHRGWDLSVTDYKKGILNQQLTKWLNTITEIYWTCDMNVAFCTCIRFVYAYCFTYIYLLYLYWKCNQDLVPLQSNVFFFWFFQLDDVQYVTGVPLKDCFHIHLLRECFSVLTLNLACTHNHHLRHYT